MQQTSMKYIKIFMFAIFTMAGVMIHTGSVQAGDYTMQTNLNDMAELMSKWSLQLSSGKMDPKAQEKLSQLLSQTSQVLRDLSSKSGDDMNREHHNRIEQMKSDWDPFDTAGRM